MAFLYRQKYKHKKTGEWVNARKWYGRFRDHTDRLRNVPLATDKTAAQAMLAELVRQVERRRAGLTDEFTAAARSPIGELKDAYLADLALRGRRARYRTEVGQLLNLILETCGFESPMDLRPEKLDTYLAGMTGSARTRAKHRQAIIGFVNWLVRKGKVPSNPLNRSTRPEGHRLRQRRAFTIEELRRLVEVAENRPLKDGLLIRWGPRTGQLDRKLPAAERARLQELGRNNALLYRTAFYTGLRADELRSLRVSDLTLDGPDPRISLPRERTKNKKDALCKIPADLARDLAAWIDARGLAADDRIFRVPRDTAKLIRADLKEAGIPYRDQGKYADFHSLRVSMSTHLSGAGVAITTARNLLRHSTIKLTADTYHDPALDDLRAAVERLPRI